MTLSAIGAIVLAATLTILLLGPDFAAADPCAPLVNPIACENSKAGDPPSDWQVQGPGDDTIQGFGTSMSVNVGQTINFKISTPSTSYHIDILRLGYYGGDGARKIASHILPTATLPQTQPACLHDASTGLIDCGNWAVSASWTVPSTAVSGMYIAHLVRDDSKDPGGDSQIPFVVRDDSSHSDILVPTNDETWEAYNAYGGNSLYTCTTSFCPNGNPAGYYAAYAVSYNRPFDGSIMVDGGASYLYYAEYQMVRFLEKNGYNVSYTSDTDLDRAGSLLLNHRVLLMSGHDEYWSGQERANVLAARNAGVNLAFFTGNESYWKTRYANSQDGMNTAYRTLITYKETHFTPPKVDPQDPPTWTGTWGDPRMSPPADGGNPPNALTGQMFLVNSGTSDITVPYQYSKLGIWRNTTAASLTPGQSVTLGAGTGTLGYEWDVDADNGFRPAGEFDLSSTTVSNVQPFVDYGTSTTNGATETHHLTLYRAASGALVFGAGTVQWSWGLDNTNAWGVETTDPSGNPPDRNMQQATVNLLAMMGAQPATLQAGLVAGSASTNTTPPTSTISSPSAGANLQDGSQVTISGTATDSGGGVVGGVEVTTDGGKTWHPATISGPDATTVNWTYTWIVHGNPTTQIESRATDDSGNIETPSDAKTINVSCPCSIWGPNVVPSTIDSGDPTSGELGVKFTSDSYGMITGIRFYKASTNTGTHIGNLWTTSGTLLASATFTNETASGWQTVTFAQPVTVMPGTTYVASYFDPKGHYSSTSGYFYPQPSPPPIGGGDYDSPPLHAVPNATSANGVYALGTTSTFPSLSFNASNYWVDPMFTPIAPPGQVTGVSATGGFGSANVSWSPPTTGGNVTSYMVTPYIGSTAQTPMTVQAPATSAALTGLQQGSVYTFVVTASNPNGSGPPSAPSNAVNVTGPTAPYPPTNVSAMPATGQAQVTWTAPFNNGSSITSYTVMPYIGSTAQTPVQVNNGSATSATVQGLKNNTAYTFTVSATNSLGTGAASSPSSAVTPQNTILDFTTPSIVDSGDANPNELGVKFTSDTGGLVDGIRFYKSAANVGTHLGNLWTASGTLLASATFTNETASGWQNVLFSNPVAINSNTTYVASYFDPKGHYSATPGGLTSSIDNAPLHAVANSTSANGLFAYTSTSAFPTSTYNANGYSVDVLFTPSPPGQVTGVSATPGHMSATVNWTAPPSGGATTYTITPYIGSTAQTPITVNGTPPATSVVVKNLTGGTAYTFTVQASNAYGNGPVSAASNAVTPTAPAAPDAPTGVTGVPATGRAQVSWTPGNDNGNTITSYTVTPFIGSTAQTPVPVNGVSNTSTTITGLTNNTAYTFKVSATNGIGTGPNSAASSAVTPQNTIFDFTTPTIVDAGDAGANELGVKFTADTSGVIDGIRFYKAAANTGTHIGNLWTASGTLLASATFTNETASGWQTVLFTSPVSITAGTTYVASYFDPNGHYSASPGQFNSSVDTPPLHALATGTSANGLYVYSSTSKFPTQTYNANGYSVDVLFTASAPGQVTNVTATGGYQAATVNWSAPTSGGATTYTVTPYIGTTAQTPVTVTGTPPANSTTVTGLTAGTAYTFTVQASNASGNGPVSAQSNAVTPNGPQAPSAPTSVTATPATTQALISWTAPNNNGSAITSYTVTPYIGSTAQTPVPVNNGSATSATIPGLTNGTAYTFKVTATNDLGTGPASTASNATTPRDTVFDFATPSIIDGGDTQPGELGVKFTADSNGSILGIRFYKATTNTGTHIGNLWTSTGTRLASATFTNETPSGWQTVLFSSPVAITAGTTYVASYFDPAGHYSATPAGLSSAFDNPPLHAVASSTSPNGVYIYGSTSTFPINTFNAGNYWVDVLFAPSS
ncbi:MAG: DUF4082 domain-containing protein [Solirubrobacteraceae bacterium]